jgi:hypothetical protein
MTGVLPNHLSDCNNMKLAFFSVEPVMQIILYYRELYSPYYLVGYRDNGAIIERAKGNVNSYDNQDQALPIKSMAFDIGRIEFGNNIISTLIKGLTIR